MKIISRIGAQGDVLLLCVDALPIGATRSEAKGGIVIAHSETGHDHSILDVMQVAHFTVPNPNICYLMIDGAHADIVHQRPFDTHETLRLTGGGSIWECRRQREWTPEGWKLIQD